MSVLDDVAAERKRQDEQWGGARHDDEHSAQNWRGIFGKHAERLDSRLCDLTDDDMDYAATESAARRQAIVLAALAVALVESLDRDRAIRVAAPAPTAPPAEGER